MWFAAYVGEWDGDVEIFVVNADGTGYRQLTDGSGWASTPAWSPDGSTVAFLRPGDDAKELWLVNVDGTNERRMPTAPLVFDNSSVLWSRRPEAGGPRQACEWFNRSMTSGAGTG